MAMTPARFKQIVDRECSQAGVVLPEPTYREGTSSGIFDKRKYKWTTATLYERFGRRVLVRYYHNYTDVYIYDREAHFSSGQLGVEELRCLARAVELAATILEKTQEGR